jgi:HK97 gp10 family phage protein
MSLFRLIAPKAGLGYVRYQVKGLKELDARLTALGPKIARKIGNRATLKGGRVIRDEAIRNAQRFTQGYTTHFLEQNIIHFRPRRHKKTGYQEVTNAMHVGVRLKGKGATRRKMRKGIAKQYPAYYWFMVNYGTRKQKRQPFLTNAFESKKHEAQTIMIDTLRQGIDKEAGKP